MKQEYVLPEFNLPAFNCPYCHVYSSQHWFYLQGSQLPTGFGRQFHDEKFMVTYCEKCAQAVIWRKETIIFPFNSIVEPPNIDLPNNIKEDYNEAASILNLSPRGSAALLRLSIEKLCKFLGEAGNDLNIDIRNLVSKGLPSKVQEALDSVRVIGNESVHPGVIDLRDNKEIANKLFKLVNFIATKLISEPKEIDEIYGLLPPNKIDGIKARDGK